MTSSPASAVNATSVISSSSAVTNNRPPPPERDKSNAEQVSISRQAQQLLDAENAAAQVSEDTQDVNSVDANSASNTSNSTASNNAVPDQASNPLAQTQDRQAARALAEYRQQQDTEPTTRADAASSASIKAIA